MTSRCLACHLLEPHRCLEGDATARVSSPWDEEPETEVVLSATAAARVGRAYQGYRREQIRLKALAKSLGLE